MKYLYVLISFFFISTIAYSQETALVTAENKVKESLKDYSRASSAGQSYFWMVCSSSRKDRMQTARIIGDDLEKTIYLVNYQKVASKFEEKAEKNLKKFFRKAQKHNWILFFDEADALFGKRTKVSDAHDRYANQEVSYLLQRIEDHDGIVILASNQKSNIDDAFSRRFESIIEFHIPDKHERLQIWKKGFSDKSQLQSNINLDKIAGQYEIAGGAIMNIIRYASLQTLKEQNNIISGDMLLRGIRKELHKEGRTI